jgi:hypothetical protein
MEKQFNKITIGADPEMFLINKTTKEPISAEGIINGTKEEPFPITDKGHFLQLDNVMCEYCIPPSENLNDFIHNINFVKLFLETELNKINISLDIVASKVFYKNQLNTENAMRFGCDPDYNAYTKEKNEIINDEIISKINFRSAGGHIHVGYENPNEENSLSIIKAMDLFLGVPSILMDSDKKRRSLYGKAGAYREKPYGFEYRTLSCFWTKNDDLIKWAYENTIEAINFIEKNGNNPFNKLTEEMIQKAINNQDEVLCRQLISEYKIKTILKTKSYVSIKQKTIS